MQFALDLPWPWSLSPVEAVQQLAYGYMPRLFARVVVGLLVGLIIGLATRRGNPFAGVPVFVMVGVGWLLASQPFPLLAFVIVIYLTIATYRGPSAARRSVPRLAAVLALRILALLLTMITLVRPVLMVRTDDKVPSVLIILLDFSKSMTFKDAPGGQARYDALQGTMSRCEPVLKKLQEENHITVVTLGFADRVIDWDPTVAPDGAITDVGGALNGAYQRFGSEANLRGILILSDGADNGRRFNAAAEARKWRQVQGKVDCFGIGESIEPGGRDKDIAITSLVVEPSPVYIKGRMIFKANVDALGCETADIETEIFIDGKPWPPEKITVNGAEPDGPTHLPLTRGNELRIETTAPENPGEVRVTLRIKPLPGEASVLNNEVSTFVTISKEGISVLLVAPLDEESKYIRQALAADPRIRLFEATRQTDEQLPAEADLFNFEKHAYDVIILRNVSARRLGNEKSQALVRTQVLKGTGLLMMGGFDSFGGTPEAGSAGNWANTPIAELLPIDVANVSGHLTSGREIPRIGMHPTERGKGYYLIQLAESPDATAKVWDRLNERIDLRGINRLGAVKGTAEVVARAGPGANDPPILASQSVGNGRVLAFAGDTTYLWRIFGLPDNTEGAEIHARFWKQTVLWLAHQENSEGAVWIKPDFRRLPAGQQQTFSVGTRGKNGMPLLGGRYEVKVFPPVGEPFVVGPVRREGDLERGSFWQTGTPGEYRLEVTGAAIDTDKKPVTGKASVRFLVYQDEREMLQTAADMDFLGKVAAAGGGRSNAYRLDDLPDFLEQLKSATLPSEKIKMERYPDWRNMKLGPFLPIWLTLFVTVLCAEWGLRRLWGMV